MFRLGLTRLLTTGATRRIFNRNVFNPSIRYSSSSSPSEQRLPLGSIGENQPLKRMGIQFRCQICDHTLQKTFTRQSYEKGVVIIRCDSCENLHLIADNLGWFKDLTNDGKFKNVAEMLRAKGETIHRVSVLPTEIDEKLPTNETQ